MGETDFFFDFAWAPYLLIKSTKITKILIEIQIYLNFSYSGKINNYCARSKMSFYNDILAIHGDIAFNFQMQRYVDWHRHTTSSM